MFQTTDDELIIQIAAGSERAFGKLFERYAPKVFGYCLRLIGDRPRAEEVSQEAWMKIIAASVNYKPQNRCLPWILTIARNAAWDHLRQRKKIQFDTDLADQELEKANLSHFDMELSLEQKKDIQKIKEAVDSLPENQRLIFVAWMTENKSHDELASEFNTTVSAIKSLIFRARRNIEEKFHE